MTHGHGLVIGFYAIFFKHGERMIARGSMVMLEGVYSTSAKFIMSLYLKIK